MQNDKAAFLFPYSLLQTTSLVACKYYVTQCALVKGLIIRIALKIRK